MSLQGQRKFLTCPVCKISLLTQVYFQTQTNQALVLDHCAICGGIWFDKDELPEFSKFSPELLPQQMVLRHDDFIHHCLYCQHAYPRRATHCSNCQQANALGCPHCQLKLQSTFQMGLKYDICPYCQGHWLDNWAWSQLWSLNNQPVSALSHQQDITVQVIQAPGRRFKGSWLKLRKQTGHFANQTKEISSFEVLTGSLSTLGFIGKNALKASGHVGLTVLKLFRPYFRH